MSSNEVRNHMNTCRSNISLYLIWLFDTGIIAK